MSSPARCPSDRRGLLDAAGARAVDVLGGYMLGTAAISAFGAASQWVIMVAPGTPIRAAAGRARALRRVHPVRRRVHRDRPGVPRRGRGRRLDDDRDHVHLHDRLQHRPGQLRDAARLWQGRQPAPGDRPSGRADRERPGGHRRHVPGRAGRGRDRDDVASGPADDRYRRRDRARCRRSRPERAKRSARQCPGRSSAAEPWTRTDPSPGPWHG